MQTILGASGQIGSELARALCQEFTDDIRLVSRHPQKINGSDTLHPASLLDAEATGAAVAGSEIAYLTVGLPPDAKLWAEQFPVMMRNTIDACAAHGTKLVFFDNTYLYPMTAAPQTEQTPFAPAGSKARTRALVTTMLLEAMEQQRLDAAICRAPEFYGPGRTQSFTNTLVFDAIKAGRRPRVPVRDDTLRTLIWTPDASRAMALVGNTPSAFGQTWHLPCDDHRLTYAEIIEVASQVRGEPIAHAVLPRAALAAAWPFSKGVREIWELLPRYAVDNIFVTEKFTTAFPQFQVTSYPDGVQMALS